MRLSFIVLLLLMMVLPCFGEWGDTMPSTNNLKPDGWQSYQTAKELIVATHERIQAVVPDYYYILTNRNEILFNYGIMNQYLTLYGYDAEYTQGKVSEVPPIPPTLQLELYAYWLYDKGKNMWDDLFNDPTPNAPWWYYYEYANRDTNSAIRQIPLYKPYLVSDYLISDTVKSECNLS